jgi:uncharacterized protein YidB (DUF937 family)
MSLLDLAGQLLGGTNSGGEQNLVTEVMGLINNHPGGLAGLVQSFQQHGLADAVNSWVGTGANLPVSSDQIQKVLGNEQVQLLASKLGISTSEVSSHLTQLLPAVIDHLTPTGQIGESGAGGLMDVGAKVLRTVTGS